MDTALVLRIFDVVLTLAIIGSFLDTARIMLLKTVTWTELGRAFLMREIVFILTFTFILVAPLLSGWWLAWSLWAVRVALVFFLIRYRIALTRASRGTGGPNGRLYPAGENIEHE